MEKTDDIRAGSRIVGLQYAFSLRERKNAFDVECTRTRLYICLSETPRPGNDRLD